MFTEKQIAVLNSHKFKQQLDSHKDKHIVVCKEKFKTSDVKAFYGDSHKYTDIEKEHADMEGFEPSADHEDAGDGDSQEQE